VHVYVCSTKSICNSYRQNKEKKTGHKPTTATTTSTHVAAYFSTVNCARHLLSFPAYALLVPRAGARPGVLDPAEHVDAQELVLAPVTGAVVLRYPNDRLDVTS
jgi:hypothetical protein